MMREIDQFVGEMSDKYDFKLRDDAMLDLAENEMAHEREKYCTDESPLDYKKLVALNVDLKSRSISLARLLSHRQETIKSAIVCEDILTARVQNKGLVQPIESPYFKPRDPANSCIDRIVVRLHHWWYIKDRRGLCMRITSVLFAITSLIVLVVEAMFFFGQFSTTDLRGFIMDEADRSYFIQNVSVLNRSIITNCIFLSHF